MSQLQIIIVTLSVWVINTHDLGCWEEKSKSEAYETYSAVSKMVKIWRTEAIIYILQRCIIRQDKK